MTIIGHVLCRCPITTNGMPFRQGRIYRYFDDGDNICVVGGEQFDRKNNSVCMNSEFETYFEDLGEVIKREWEKVGLLVDGKKISKKAFKLAARFTGYGSGCNVLYILFFGVPKELMYAFYPSLSKNNKQVSLDNAYANYLAALEGTLDFLGFDEGMIQRGNSGIPFSFRDIRWDADREDAQLARASSHSLIQMM